VVSLEQYPFKQGEKAMEMMMKILNEKPDNDTQAHPHFYSDELPSVLMIH